MKNWKYINGAEVGNATIKFYGETIDLTKKSESDLKEILEELQMMHEGADEQRAIKEELKKRQIGNAFDFETQAVVDRKEAVKTAEEELRKAEAERNKHRGERYWEEAYITAKKDVERAKENLARAQRNKAGNSDGVARMFQGLVKDEDKDEKHYEGAIDDLGKVGNAKYDIAFQGQADGNSEQYYFVYDYQTDPGAHRPVKKFKTRDEAKAYAKKLNEKEKVGNVQFAGNYYDIKQEPDGNFYIYVNGGAKTYGPYRSKGEAEGKLKSILAERNRTGNSSSDEEYWKKQYIEAARKKGIPENKIQEFIKKIEKEGAKGVLSPIKNGIGNSYSDKLPTAMDYKKALDEIIEKKNINPDEARRKYGQFTYAQWEKELGHKIGNSEDEKFAYVMREFEEGKLKSSSGETVTDPAQAKAIAYSESKKAENGLARARKAIH